MEDETDKELKTFSIERDKEYILPLIHAAKEQEEELTLLASPWSPPAFMKTNGEMNHGGKLKKEYYGMWADMVAHYVTEYKNRAFISAGLQYRMSRMRHRHGIPVCLPEKKNRNTYVAI